MTVRFDAPRGVVREDYDRINRQIVLFIEPGEVMKHAFREHIIYLRLVFDMDKEESIFAPEVSLYQQIDLFFRACCDIREDLLIQELYRPWVQVSGDIGQKKRTNSMKKVVRSSLNRRS